MWSLEYSDSETASRMVVARSWDLLQQPQEMHTPKKKPWLMLVPLS